MGIRKHHAVAVAALAATAGLAVAAPGREGDPDFYATPRVPPGTRTIELGRGDSLKRAMAEAMPGDVIELRSGTYPAPKGASLGRSGRPDAWITIRAAKGTRPVIDLAGGELQLSSSYVLLEGVEVVNGTGNNIHVVPPNGRTPITHIIIRGVRSADMGRGTGAALKIAGLWNNGHGAPAEQIYVEDCDLSGSRDNAIVDAVGVRRSVVRGCWLHDPVKIAMRSPGIFFKGGSSEILIERNLVSGIHGNPAIMVGGDTGAKWFDGLHAAPKVEGVNEVVRGNIIADEDDAAVELRGAVGVQVLSNTIVTRSTFAVFRFTWGGSGSGVKIGNQDVLIANNLVIASGAAYALNDGNADVSVRFGPQLWAGRFAGARGPGMPSFPQGEDRVVDHADLGALVASTNDAGLHGIADAVARFTPLPGSPAGFGALERPR
jgi:hypothetical protein